VNRKLCKVVCLRDSLSSHTLTRRVGRARGSNPIHQHVDPTQSNPVRILTIFIQSNPLYTCADLVKICVTVTIAKMSNELHVRPLEQSSLRSPLLWPGPSHKIPLTDELKSRSIWIYVRQSVVKVIKKPETLRFTII